MHFVCYPVLDIFIKYILICAQFIAEDDVKFQTHFKQNIYNVCIMGLK